MDALPILPTEVFDDDTKSIVTENDSPDIRFQYSLNPYRGCEHGCSYCYARPYHEYLGLNAGLDFETKILAKKRAPELFRAFIAKPNWTGKPIAMSGVTDCYQPIERELRLTRGCLELADRVGQPIDLITKGTVILRDLDVLASMARRQLIHVSLAVTTLRDKLARSMEPRAALPARRLEIIARLADIGVPVRVLVAPLIPGLTDEELPAILGRSAEAGARSASYVLLRLPGAVRPIFLDWLERELPLKKELIESAVRSTRAGKLNDPCFGSRMKGVGERADQIKQLFQVMSKRFGLDQPLAPLSSDHFQRPSADATGPVQLSLF